jgi:hypothetical protein
MAERFSFHRDCFVPVEKEAGVKLLVWQATK